MTVANRVDAPLRAIPAKKQRVAPPPTQTTGDDGAWLTTGECWQAIAPRMDMSRSTFERLLSQWKKTGERPERLQGIQADLQERSRHPAKSNRARWLRLETPRDGD